VPNDQVIAYDQSGVLHGVFLTYANSNKAPQLNIFYGSTADPNADGVNGRAASVWQWNPNRVNLDPKTANEGDNPWLALGNDHAYVAYSEIFPHGNGSGDVAVRVSASADNGATFTTDNNINSTNNDGSLPFSDGVTAGPGQRLATDQLGDVYSFYQWAEPPAPSPGEPNRVHYRLNMSSDGGQTWKFTSLGGHAGGLDVDDGLSLQIGSSFGGVNRTSYITAVAADPTGQHVYPVYGKEDANGVDRIWLAEFHPDGQGGLVERPNPVALSVPGQRSALASAAVTASGTVFVMYDSFDGTEFHVLLATSTDFGQTFTDQDLYDFTTTSIPYGYNGLDRLLGDYQFLTAVGNNVYGTFAGRGNVVDPNTGIDTTGYMDPFFFTATAPRVGSPATAASAPAAVLRANAAFASSAVQPFILPAAATAPAAPLPGSAAPSALTAHQSGDLPASGTSSPPTAKATDAVFAASSSTANDDGAWLFALWSPGSLDVM
jgi:hypothetical protein